MLVNREAGLRVAGERGDVGEKGCGELREEMCGECGNSAREITHGGGYRHDSGRDPWQNE
jgi:hypothetical protein